MTHLADFDSWEHGTKFMVDDLPRLEAAKVNVIAFGIGSFASGEQFCERTKISERELTRDKHVNVISKTWIFARFRGCASGETSRGCESIVDVRRDRDSGDFPSGAIGVRRVEE